mgnify:CR=1 FL=1
MCCYLNFGYGHDVLSSPSGIQKGIPSCRRKTNGFSIALRPFSLLAYKEVCLLRRFPSCFPRNLRIQGGILPPSFLKPTAWWAYLGRRTYNPEQRVLPEELPGFQRNRTKINYNHNIPLYIVVVNGKFENISICWIRICFEWVIFNIHSRKRVGLKKYRCWNAIPWRYAVVKWWNDWLTKNTAFNKPYRFHIVVQALFLLTKISEYLWWYRVRKVVLMSK